MTNHRVLRVLLRGLVFCLLVGSLGASRLSAQVIKGAISGTIIDPSAAAVPEAEIRATNTERGQVFTTKSEPTGLFRLALLPVGTYELEVSKAGFRKLVLSKVEVNAGRDYGLGSLQLEVGEITTTVEVSAAPPLLETTSAQVSTAIKGELLQSIPGVIANQGLDNLALLVPGVIDARDNGFGNTNGVSFAVNGLRGRSNDQQIDGQNNNDNSVTGPYLFFTNPDFVQEYQIITNNFGPEYGRNAGSVVNIVTKSGTNTWHGSIVGVESNSAMDSLSNVQKAFQGLKKVPRYNDIFTGAGIGGPLARDRVFLFAGFDNEIRSEKEVYSTGLLTPTPTGLAQLGGCPWVNADALSALQKYGPFGVGGGGPTISGEPGLVSIFDPATGTECLVEMAGVQRTLPTGFHQYDGVFRLDVNPTDSDRIYGRYLIQKLPFFNADSFGRAAAGYPVNVPAISEDIGLSWTHNLSGRMVNEARFSYGRLNVQFGGNSIGNTIPVMSKLDSGLANINLPSAYADFGPANNAPQGRVVNTYQVQDNWSYFRGRHQFKAGFNYTYQRSINNFLPNINGTFNYTSFSNFMANIPSSINIAAGSPSLDFREHQMFFYVGDDLKVTPNLTLNLGLTYSYFGQPANLFYDITKKREENASTAFFDPNLPLSIRTADLLPSVKTNWGPSVGFAYTPRGGGWLTGEGKTVLRGGYRLAYDPPFYNIYLNMASAAPQVLLQTLTGADATGNPLPADPFGPAVRQQLAPFLVFGVADPRRFNQTRVTTDFHPDKVHSWSFGIQRQLTDRAVVEARYVGNRGRDLFQSINQNPRVRELARDFPNVVPSGIAPCTDATAPGYRRADCTLGVIRQRTNTGYSDYHALQTQLRLTNVANQLSMNLNYTFSKTTDNVSEIFGTFGGGNTYAFSQNPFDYTKGEHAVSGLDIPHSFSVGFYEEIPAFRNQKGALGKILGGWAISGTYVIASGQPYSPVQYGLNFFTGGVQYYDVTFANTFVGSFETARPFMSNPTAPPGNVGIFAGDACNYFGGDRECNMASDTLLNFNSLNTGGAATPVPGDSVRYIVNGYEASQIFGTPFGNAGRNTLRTYHQNTGSFALFKNIRFNERTRLQWWVQFANVFNHPNFSSIDPLVDDAGYALETTGFANPTLYDGGNRIIRFGVKVLF